MLINSNVVVHPNLKIGKEKPFSAHFSFSSPRNKIIIKHRRNLLVAAAQNLEMEQKIIILNKRREKLVGVLHETESPQIVVLCHGFRSSKESKLVVNLARVLEEEGISAFRFDFHGNGESEGSFQYGNYSSEVEDLRAVIEYFTGINRSTVAIVGHSKGGNVVLLYASKYHDIGAVVNISGRYNLKKGIEERLGANYLERLKKDGYIDVKLPGGVQYRVTKESMIERLNTNMHEACLSVDPKCRVLTVHGSADEDISVEDAELGFAKIIPNHWLEIIQGADHRYSKHQDELAAPVLKFIKDCL
ncbi:hypothetical protein ABFS83_10G052700 [Erythranthe nasuta]